MVLDRTFFIYSILNPHMVDAFNPRFTLFICITKFLSYTSDYMATWKKVQNNEPSAGILVRD